MLIRGSLSGTLFLSYCADNVANGVGDIFERGLKTIRHVRKATYAAVAPKISTLLAEVKSARQMEKIAE